MLHHQQLNRNNIAVGLTGITLDYILAARPGNQCGHGAYDNWNRYEPPKDIYWLDEWRNPNPLCLVYAWAFRLRDFIFEEFVWDGSAQLVFVAKPQQSTEKLFC
jgi:hypothetical protein